MLKNFQKGFSSVLIIVIILVLGIGVTVYLSQKPQVFKPKASGQPEKQIFANFYWYYPWYGAQFKNAAGKWQFVENQNGYIGLQAFRWKPLDPIPYINSSERTFGDYDDSRAKDWFKGSFERAGSAGLTSLAVMARPDLEKWPVALTQMVESQKELEAEGKPFPKILLHYDGVDFWDKASPNTGQLTGPGQDYDVIWNGTKSTFDTIYSLVTPQELPQYFVTYPDSSTLAILIYRIEGSAENFTTSDWWTTQLRSDFARTYLGKNIYLILDDLWCNWDYGVNNSVHTKTCNGDNYYRYGGSWAGAIKSTQAKPPVIYSVGPGFDNDMSSPTDGLPPIYREDGKFYQKNLNLAKNSGADWIHIETFNFGEEGSAIDRTAEFGEKYLQMTKNFSDQFALFPSITPIPIILPSPSSSCKPLPQCITDGSCEMMPQGSEWCPLPSATPRPSSTSSSCTSDSDCSNGQLCQQVCTASYPATCSSSCVFKSNSSSTPETIPGETAGSPPEPAKTGDLNNDGKINLSDFNIFVRDFNSKNLRSDLNNDGVVDYGDFSKFLSVWGS